MLKQNSCQSKISFHLPAYMSACAICTHIRIHICQDLVHLDSSGEISSLWILISSRPCQGPGSHLSTPCAVCVCVCACVYTLIHLHALPPPFTNKEHTDNTPVSPSVKNSPPRQAKSALHKLAKPYYPRSPTIMNKLRIRERMCTPSSECFRKCVCWCRKHLCNLYSCICAGA